MTTDERIAAMVRIVPNSIRDQINRALDRAIADCPEAAADRDVFYRQLLDVFDETGEVPEFTLERRK